MALTKVRGGAFGSVVGELEVSSATGNNTDKRAFFVTNHYSSSEEDAAGVILQSANGDNLVDIGGSQSAYNAATKIRFYTGANSTTTTGTEAMRVNSDASSLIRMNTTGAYNSVTANVPVLHIDVNGTSNTPNTGVAVGGLASSEVGFSTMAGSSVDYYSALFHNSGASVVGSIFSTTSGTTFNTSSDYRVKENVVDMTGAITRVKQLSPKRFNFIVAPEKTVDGFLAHEAQTVVPESVTGEKDAVDDNGKEIIQGIDQSKLVPLLTGALQEAITKIETLETEMTALKARVTALENA